MIERLSVLASSVQGECSSDAVFSGVSADTRQLRSGQLFFALKGQRDGHDFVSAARDAGAAAAVVEHFCDSNLPQLKTESVMDALKTLAHLNRQSFFGAVIGVTGSSGKTTVKNMIHNILAQVGPVLASPKSYNNSLGICLTLGNLQARHRFIVQEMGANAPNEIAMLAEIVRPQTAVITNAGRAHLEGFGSLAGVAAAKGEILDALPAEGTAVLPSDEAFFMDWRRRAGSRRIITYGSGELAESRLVRYRPRKNGSHVELDSLKTHLGFDLQLPGRHNALNAAAAAAVAISLRIEGGKVEAGLSQTVPVSGRLQPVPGIGGSLIYDDSYNANPDSVSKAIDFLSEQKGHRILVLGDMAELGCETVELHREIGHYAKKKGIDEVHGLGQLAAHSVETFCGEKKRAYQKVEELMAAIGPRLQDQSVVLVKGSRLSRMEVIVDLLRGTG